MGGHGGITTGTIEAGRHANVGADVGITGTTLTSGAVATLSALAGISDTTVTAEGDATAFAGTDLAATMTSHAGHVKAASVDGLTGTYEAAKDLYLGTSGVISSTVATAKGGKTTLFAHAGIDATTATSPTAITAVSLESVKGNFSSPGTTSIFAGRGFDGTASGAQGVAVSAGDSVQGSVTSTGGTASAVSVGASLNPETANIAATVSGHQGAKALAVIGDLATNSQVTSALGDVQVGAGDDCVAVINAHGHATIFAAGDMDTGNIEAGGNLSAVCYGSLGSPLTATGGWAFASAGTDLSGHVAGKLGAFGVARTGIISGDVTSEAGSAGAIALGDVSGAVSGGLHASVAALGSVSGPVTATTGDVGVLAGGSVSSDISAGRSAGVMCRQSFTGTVSAGLDGGVITLASHIGTVSAGRDAGVWFAESASGAVTANRHRARQGQRGERRRRKGPRRCPVHRQPGPRSGRRETRPIGRGAG